MTSADLLWACREVASRIHLVGAEVVDYASVGEDSAVEITGAVEGELHGWYEELDVRDASALASYADGPFAGTTAVAQRGRVVYLAGAARVPTLAALYARLCADARFEVLAIPDGVEAVPLRNGRGDLLFLLNHSEEHRVVELGPGAWHDHVAGAPAAEAITVPPLGIALVESRRVAAAAADKRA
jgi:beta-galactosidase